MQYLIKVLHKNYVNKESGKYTYSPCGTLYFRDRAVASEVLNALNLTGVKAMSVTRVHIQGKAVDFEGWSHDNIKASMRYVLADLDDVVDYYKQAAQ